MYLPVGSPLLLLCIFSIVASELDLESKVKYFKWRGPPVIDETIFSNPTSFDYDFDEDVKSTADQQDLYDQFIEKLPQFRVYKLGEDIGFTQVPIVTRKSAVWSTKANTRGPLDFFATKATPPPPTFSTTEPSVSTTTQDMRHSEVVESHKTSQVASQPEPAFKPSDRGPIWRKGGQIIPSSHQENLETSTRGFKSIPGFDRESSDDHQMAMKINIMRLLAKAKKRLEIIQARKQQERKQQESIVFFDKEEVVETKAPHSKKPSTTTTTRKPTTTTTTTPKPTTTRRPTTTTTRRSTTTTTTTRRSTTTRPTVVPMITHRIRTSTHRPFFVSTTNSPSTQWTHRAITTTQRALTSGRPMFSFVWGSRINPTTTTPVPFTRREFSRRPTIHHLSESEKTGVAQPKPVIIQRGMEKHHGPTFNCRVLNPFKDGKPSAQHNPSCKMLYPGLSLDGSCQCFYIVSERDATGCAEGFLYACKPLGAHDVVV